jgi:hypothetical protein
LAGSSFEAEMAGRIPDIKIMAANNVPKEHSPYLEQIQSPIRWCNIKLKNKPIIPPITDSIMASNKTETI